MTLKHDQVNSLIAKIYKGSREFPVETFKDQIFLLIREYIDFDSGLWVTGAITENLIHSIHLYNQPQEMMDNYARFQENDYLLQCIIKNHGKTHNADDLLSREEFVASEIYRYHCHQYGMERTLSTCFLDETSGLTTFVSFYRSDPNHIFNEDDRLLKETLMPHLIEANTNNLFIHLQSHRSVKSSNGGSAICDFRGILHHLEPKFVQALLLEWPVWKGPRLPDAITSLLSENTGTARYSGDRIQVNADKLSELFYLQINAKGPFDSLSDRQRTIAKLLAEGLSYKQVAKQLNIASSTVTNHANAIYERVGVTNKTELAALYANS